MTTIKSQAVVFAILSAWWVVTGPLGTTEVPAAQWLAPAAADRITGDWVKQIEADLTGDRFGNLFAAMPADPPIPAILRMLNNADKALADHRLDYAKSFVDQAVRILDSGVAKGWYGRSDIEPVKAMIVERAEAALEGHGAEQAPNPRWSGYSDNERLGLTNASGDKQQASSPSDGAR